MTALTRVLRWLRHPRTPAPDWWGPACTCTTHAALRARDDLHATLRAEGTRYDAEWPSVLAAEANEDGWPAARAALHASRLAAEVGGDLAAMTAPLPGMARDALGTYAEWTYAEPVKPRGRHRQTDPLDLILADLRDLDGQP